MNVIGLQQKMKLCISSLHFVIATMQQRQDALLKHLKTKRKSAIRIARSKLQNLEDVKEVVTQAEQETIGVLFEGPLDAWPTLLDHQSKASSLYFDIVKKRAISRHRHNATLKNTPSQPEEKIESKAEGNPADTANLWDQLLQRQRVQKALVVLPPELRVPFMLKEYEGYTYEEIGRYLDIAKSTAKERCEKAQKLFGKVRQLRSLPDPYRRILICVDVRGLSTKQIAMKCVDLVKDMMRIFKGGKRIAKLTRSTASIPEPHLTAMCLEESGSLSLNLVALRGGTLLSAVTRSLAGSHCPPNSGDDWRPLPEPYRSILLIAAEQGLSAESFVRNEREARKIVDALYANAKAMPHPCVI